MRIYETAVRKRVTFIMIFLAVVGFGIVSLFQLQPELLPDIDFPAVTVIQDYSGVGPEEIESLISRPTEQAVSGISRVENVSSSIQEGRSITIIEFEWGTNMDAAVSDVRDAMGRIERQLPDDASSPFIIRFDINAMPIMMIGLSGPYDRLEMREISENIVEPRLESVEGVAAADTRGGQEREIRIELDKNRIESLGIPISSIVSAVGSDNITRPGGSIKTPKRELILRTSNEFRNVDDIKDVIITTREGVPIHVSDVAQVKDTFKDRENEMLIDGEPGVMLTIQRQSGANTVQTSRNVREEAERIRDELPAGVSFTVLMDQAEFIEQSIGNLANIALQGGLLAVIVLMLFLGNIRATLIIAISIPISIIASFTALRAGGLTINVMSLGGLALAIGMLVDNSVVVLENIYRHREEGQSPAEGAIWGTHEVAMPIVASTLTTISVFLPIFFVPGIAGIFFREQALTVTLSLAISLIAALTLIPLMSSLILRGKIGAVELKKGKTDRIKQKIKNSMNKMENIYRRSLNWTLSHKKMVVTAVLALFIFSISAVFVLRWIPSEFMPRVDDGRINVNIDLPVGTRLEETINKTSEIEKIAIENIKEHEIETVRSQIGPGGFMGGRTGSHVSRINIELIPASRRQRSQEEIANGIRESLTDIPGANIRVGMGGGMGGGGAFGTDSPIEVEIFGFDLRKQAEIAERIKEVIEDIPGTADVRTGIEDPRPEYSVTVDRRRAGSMGLTVQSVSSQLEAYTLGQTAGFFRTGEDEYPITVRLREKDRENIQNIHNLPILSQEGQIIPLKSVTNIFPSEGPVEINRYNQRRRTTVSADYTGRDLGGISRQIENAIDEQIILPEGFFVNMGGEVEEQRETFFWLGLAFLGAIILVYMVMASQFESLLDPFIVLFTIPMALIGVVWMLFFTGTSLSIISAIGIIMLTGIVVNNTIVLVDYTNLLRARGFELKDAVITAGRKRLRPVLMTALTTMLAMTPMALGLGEGAELSYPIARSLIGGLLAATFLTLYVIPVVYTIFESRLNRKEAEL